MIEFVDRWRGFFFGGGGGGGGGLCVVERLRREAERLAHRVPPGRD